jgi:nitrate reductase cytochrome c-type subunit
MQEGGWRCHPASLPLRLSCHARARTAESQAPMVSITHFMYRDGQFLASVSPRRFFCTECHVPQAVATPPVTNDFTDDSLECRNCHSAQSMDITKQSPRTSVAHERFLFSGEKACIDCHKGIAHKLPDMRGVPGRQ